MRVTLGGCSYQTTVGSVRGEFLFPVSAAVREQAGVAAGDEVEVGVELDTAPRELVIPAELAAALDADAGAREAFELLSYSNRKRHVLAVEGAKTEDTRQRRLAKILSRTARVTVRIGRAS